MKDLLVLAVIAFTLLKFTNQAQATAVIGHPNTDWIGVGGNSGGTFNLETTPGTITAGATVGQVMAYSPEVFDIPVNGSTYTFKGSIILATPAADSNLFVFGFATDPEQPVGTNFMELVFQVEANGNAGILWIGGTTTAIQNNPTINLFEYLYGGTGISDTETTDIDITWTLNSPLNWTLSGTIISNGVTLWDTATTTTADDTILGNNTSVFFLGSPQGEVTINSGEFTGPVPEPTSALLLCMALVMLLFRRPKVSV